MSWYVGCFSKDLRSKPKSVMIDRTPIVLCRLGERVVAFLDRCPHRNVPLSNGRIEAKTLRCGYHGWVFDRDGKVACIPSLRDEGERLNRTIQTFETVESDGLIWIQRNKTGDTVPRAVPRETSAATIFYEATLEARMFDILENMLDVPHTSFLHKGLFRKSPATEINVEVRHIPFGVEAEYFGEPRPKGWIGRLLAPRQSQVSHVDRFFLPSIAQVEYRLGDRFLMRTTSFVTPITDKDVKVFSVGQFKTPLPHILVKGFAFPIAMKILRQDAKILKEQFETIRHFGEEQFIFSKADVLAPHIYQLLRNGSEKEKQGKILSTRLWV